MKKTICNSIKKQFSTNIRDQKIVIIGAGTAGVSVASQLSRNNIKKSNITLIDPASKHYYQPGFTKIGGGVYKTDKYVSYDLESMVKGFGLIKDEVVEINPNNKLLKLKGNSEVNYDTLIVASGLKTDFQATEGLKEALDDPKSNVCSVYSFEYAFKTSRLRNDFKGGKALFTQPPAPIKCAGAPQKLLYLCSADWDNRKIKHESHFYTPLPQMFGIKFYSDALAEIVKQRGLNPHYMCILQSVKNHDTAVFKNTKTNEVFEEKFDFLHVVPRMKPWEYLSNISDSTGFVEVNSDLRHKKYPDIWAIGDCNNLPNAKTAAAVFSQSPVLVQNLLNNDKKTYCGYSACPIFLGNKKLMLAEFSIKLNEKGESETTITPTFEKNQSIPRIRYYFLTASLGLIYRLVEKGIWYGKSCIFDPTKKGIINHICHIMKKH